MGNKEKATKIVEDYYCIFEDAMKDCLARFGIKVIDFDIIGEKFF